MESMQSVQNKVHHNKVTININTIVSHINYKIILPELKHNNYYKLLPEDVINMIGNLKAGTHNIEHLMIFYKMDHIKIIINENIVDVAFNIKKIFPILFGDSAQFGNVQFSLQIDYNIAFNCINESIFKSKLLYLYKFSPIEMCKLVQKYDSTVCGYNCSNLVKTKNRNNMYPLNVVTNIEHGENVINPDASYFNIYKTFKINVNDTCNNYRKEAYYTLCKQDGNYKIMCCSYNNFLKNVFIYTKNDSEFYNYHNKLNNIYEYSNKEPEFKLITNDHPLYVMCTYNTSYVNAGIPGPAYFNLQLDR
jgi:hypothetical protein